MFLYLEWLYLEWLQNVLQALIAMIGASAFTSTFPPIQFWRLLYCWLPCHSSPALFHLLLTDLSLHSRTIESVSLFQSAILTKRSNSLLAVHVLVTQQHSFRFYLASLTTNWGSNWCIFLQNNVRVSWRLNEKVSINKWAPTLLFVSYKYCLSTIILKEATHICQFF